jgi:hypothetical protein
VSRSRGGVVATCEHELRFADGVRNHGATFFAVVRFTDRVLLFRWQQKTMTTTFCVDRISFGSREFFSVRAALAEWPYALFNKLQPGFAAFDYRPTCDWAHILFFAACAAVPRHCPFFFSLLCCDSPVLFARVFFFHQEKKESKEKKKNKTGLAKLSSEAPVQWYESGQHHIGWHRDDEYQLVHLFLFLWSRAFFF